MNRRFLPCLLRHGRTVCPVQKGQANTFVNAEGYKEFVAEKERAFRKTLADQQNNAN